MSLLNPIIKNNFFVLVSILLVISACAATSNKLIVVKGSSFENVFTTFKQKNKKYSNYQVYNEFNESNKTTYFQDINEDGHKDAVFIMASPSNNKSGKATFSDFTVVILKGMRNNTYKALMINPNLIDKKNFDIIVSNGGVIKIQTDYQGSVFASSSDVFSELALKLEKDKLIIQRIMYDSSWELESAYPRTYYDYNLLEKTYVEGWPIEKYDPSLKDMRIIGYEAEGKLEKLNGKDIVYTSYEDLKRTASGIAMPSIIHKNTKKIPSLKRKRIRI